MEATWLIKSKSKLINQPLVKLFGKEGIVIFALAVLHITLSNSQGFAIDTNYNWQKQKSYRDIQSIKYFFGLNNTSLLYPLGSVCLLMYHFSLV